MPFYEYECTKCGKTFELQQKMTDKPRERCPECRGKVIRVITGGGGVILKGNGFYGIPYRVLLPLGLDNLLAAGRIVSTTSEALASIRVMVGCMVTGQAAGCAAYLRHRLGVSSFKDIPAESLRDNLRSQNVLLDADSIRPRNQ